MKIISLLTNHPLWGLLTLAVIVWYSTVTVYVGIRGALDIKHMLANLRKNHADVDAGKKS